MFSRFVSINVVLVGTCVLAGCGASSSGTTAGGTKSVELLNVSYDPTRELWKDLNAAFTADYEKSNQTKVTIKQSHGGSASQARAIIDGLEADVATLSLWPDTDALRKQGLLKDGWEDQLPNRSLPYTSTVVFVVRQGNPKKVKDWADLVQPGISVITPNPKTSGNGRLSFLAAWGSITLNGGTEAEARDFVKKLYGNVAVLDTGARGATATFSLKGLGDVFLTMESEAYLTQQEAPGKFEIIYPSQSILHEPHLAVVDSVVDKKGTREVTEAYLKFLYTPTGQEIVAKHFFRPTDPDVFARHRDQFPEVKMFPIAAIAASWDEAQGKFFAEGGIFDGMYRPVEAANRE
ncbi:MAG: sulfate ABC transporter substrate-binding protein [Planctomycetaceae bacterium]|nr:sulfate ABC transporter substrate-binding protein [Planctomycetaceae bacterium]